VAHAVKTTAFYPQFRKQRVKHLRPQLVSIERTATLVYEEQPKVILVIVLWWHGNVCTGGVRLNRLDFPRDGVNALPYADNPFGEVDVTNT
jgi:hypothetical protein